MRKSTKDVFLAISLIGSSALLVMGQAEAQTGCSQKESQVIQSYIQQVAQAAYSGNLQAAMQLGQQLQNALSPACLAALNQLQGQQPYGGGYGGGGYGGNSPGAPSIYDHGGGTYSVPGGVTCGPSGCY